LLGLRAETAAQASKTVLLSKTGFPYLPVAGGRIARFADYAGGKCESGKAMTL